MFILCIDGSLIYLSRMINPTVILSFYSVILVSITVVVPLYDMICYCMKTHRVWQWQVQDLDLAMDSQRTPYTSPSWASYKVNKLVQERCNSSALPMELRLSCNDPSGCSLLHPSQYKMSQNVNVRFFLIFPNRNCSLKHMWLSIN